MLQQFSAYCPRRNLPDRPLRPDLRVGVLLADLPLLGRGIQERAAFSISIQSDTGQGIVAQAAKYMTALKALAESEGLRGARLLIITGQPNEQLADLVQVQAEKAGVKCEWHLYRVRFELSKA